MPPSPRSTPNDDRWVPDSPSQNGAVSNAQSARAYRFVVLAYIIAVSMPPIGFILGIVVANRSSKMGSRHGAAIIALSIIAGVLWILIITSGALSTASTDY